MTTTYDRLVNLLVGQFDADEEKIGPDVTFEELEMDSLFLVEMLLVAQSEFGVKLGEEVASPRDTLRHTAAAIDRLIAAGTVTS